jgi:hypothetical protein
MDEYGQEAQSNPIPPNIEIDENIISPDCPYDVSVNQQGIAELLKMTGVPEEQIPAITIILKKQSPKEEKNLMGFYYRAPNNKSIITLYTDNLYSRFPIIGKARGVFYQRARQKNNPHLSNKNLFPELVSGKRFTAYLNVVPEERGIKMAERLQAIAASRSAVEGLAHEGVHARRYITGTRKEGRGRRILARASAGGAMAVPLTLELATMNALGARIDIIPVLIAISASSVTTAKFFGEDAYYRYFDQEEKEARAFGKEIAKNPRYKFITFTPKQPTS